MASASEQKTNAGSSSWQNQDVWGPQSPYLQQLYGQGAELAGAPAPSFNPAVAGAWQSALSGQINPTTGQVIDDATREMGLDFQRNVMPGIRRSAVGAGAAGGGREGIAEGLAAGEAVRAMATTRASMTGAALDRATASQTAALGMSPSLMSLQASLPWSNLSQFRDVLGAPVVLGSGGSQSQSRGQSYSLGVGSKK